MSSALLEGTRRSGEHDPGQRPLFDDLRRAEPGPEPEQRAEPAARGPAVPRGERGPRSGGDRLMLEDHLERIWEGLLAVGAADCPVCMSRMEAFGESAACGSCGAGLY
ncbi:MAG: hypothetical protein H0U12_09065 [Thermoleophilaceae bacterium]|nr:hypothetical protein [Thermoleophilaceae bacterium]